MGAAVGRKTPAMICSAIDIEDSEDGRGRVCGQFSVGVVRQPDVNEGFDEQFDKVVGENGRGDAYAGDAAYRW